MNQPQDYRRLVLAIILCISVLAMLAGGGFLLATNVLQKQQQATTQPTPKQVVPTAQPTQAPTPTRLANAPISPLIFGTNMGLFNEHDQVLYSAPTRAMMQQLHIRIVRMPTRLEISNALEMQAAQAIKDIGAVPLVVLLGGQHDLASTIAADTRMVTDMNQVFGNSKVYYEFGNEDDYNGVTIENYTQRWNAVVPQLKHLALNGWFIGPVSYQYSHDNLTTFLQSAQPRPDAISWHEYTCSLKDPAADCIASIDKWTTHISDARSVMQTILTMTLPIMITEWNYAPDQQTQSNGQPIADGKYSNPQFMKTWTTKALQTLVANRVFASMQYTVTNTALSMIGNDLTVTTQGATFQALYQQVITHP